MRAGIVPAVEHTTARFVDRSPPKWNDRIHKRTPRASAVNFAQLRPLPGREHVVHDRRGPSADTPRSNSSIGAGTGERRFNHAPTANTATDVAIGINARNAWLAS